MPHFSLSKFLLVLTVALAIVQPTIAATNVRVNRSVYPRLFAESTKPQPKVSEDGVFEDVTSNRVEKLKQFLDKGGSPNRFFHAAINAGSIDSVKMMLDRGANVNLVGNEGLTPIAIAAKATYRGGFQLVELLINKGANVNARASKGSTPLMFAAWGVAPHYEDEYVRVVQLLIKRGAKVNVKNKMGNTPLSIANSGKWNKIVAALKRAGAKQ